MTIAKLALNKLLLRGQTAEYFSPVRLGRNRLWLLNDVPNHVNLYYKFCAQGIAGALRDTKAQKDVYLCFPKHVPKLPKNSWSIVLQVEQTVLAPTHPQDAAESSDLEYGAGGEKYLVRLLGPREGFEKASRIIDYSAVNIEHVRRSNLRGVYDGKATYIAPLLGEMSPRHEPKSPINLMTMFGSPQLGRRSQLIQQLKSANMKTTNIDDYGDYARGFRDCGLLVNYRQFNHFRTVEELRILPALLQRVIVVSEDGPYLDSIPYHRFAKFVDTSSIVQEVATSLKNYKEIWFETFGADSEFQSVIEDLYDQNRRNFRFLLG